MQCQQNQADNALRLFSIFSCYFFPVACSLVSEGSSRGFLLRTRRRREPSTTRDVTPTTRLTADARVGLAVRGNFWSSHERKPQVQLRYLQRRAASLPIRGGTSWQRALLETGRQLLSTHDFHQRVCAHPSPAQSKRW